MSKNRDRKRIRRDIALAKQGLGFVENREELIGALADEFEASEKPIVGPITITEYNITYDEMPNPLVEALPEEDRTRIHDVAADVVGEHKPRIDDLEELILKHPHIPQLFNHLYASLILSHRYEEAEQVTRTALELFPSYLFAVLSYMEHCLKKNDVAEAERALAGRVTLKKFYPDRKVFHISEYIFFHAVMGILQVKKGNFAAAQRFRDIIADMEPDHQAVETLSIQIELGMMPRVIDRLMDKFKKPKPNLGRAMLAS